MPRVEIPIVQITRAGVAPAAQVTGDATNDHYLAWNDGGVVLEVGNVDAGASHAATVITPGSVDSLAVADLTITVPASATRYAGPFPPAIYNQSDGTVQIDADGTNLRFRAFAIAK
jgi:hypothetical protein